MCDCFFKQAELFKRKNEMRANNVEIIGISEIYKAFVTAYFVSEG
jgi:uncharacterized protein YegP (UPF0339 family)